MLKVAVIGLGNMGRFHANKYVLNSNVDLVAICDHGIQKESVLIEGLAVPAYNNLDKLLNEHEIQAVSIASPTSTHYEVAKQCIENGIHCLIEKPITESVDQSTELIELAQSKDLVLTVGHIERFNPAVTKVKECIDQGMLGQLSSLSFRRNGPFPPQIDDADVVIDLAVHDIDIANYWLSSLPDSITGYKASLITGGRPDHAEILAKYKNTHVFFQVNWVTPTRVRTAVLTGSNGYIEMDFIAKSIHYFESKADYSKNRHGETVAKFQSVKPIQINVDAKDSLDEQIKCFLSAVEHRTELLVTPEQAKNALELALKI